VQPASVLRILKAQQASTDGTLSQAFLLALIFSKLVLGASGG
jgi:hypothetical protein